MPNVKEDIVSVIWDQVIRQQDKMTQIAYGITPGSLDTLEEEIGGVLVTIKLHHFKRGCKYKHLVDIAPEKEYCDIIGDGNLQPADVTHVCMGFT